MINDPRGGKAAGKKTAKALIVALSSLLEFRNFANITVTDICEEALVSRAAFYSHFIDKYDLLKIWMLEMTPDFINMDGAYENLEQTINKFVRDNRAVIRNVARGADSETLAIMLDYMISAFIMSADGGRHDKAGPRENVMLNFYGGGMVYYLLRLTEDKIPSGITPMNACLYEIIKQFRRWRSE